MSDGQENGRDDNMLLVVNCSEQVKLLNFSKCQILGIPSDPWPGLACGFFPVLASHSMIL